MAAFLVFCLVLTLLVLVLSLPSLSERDVQLASLQGELQDEKDKSTATANVGVNLNHVEFVIWSLSRCNNLPLGCTFLHSLVFLFFTGFHRTAQLSSS